MLDLFKTKINKAWGLYITDRHLRFIEVGGDPKKWKISCVGKINLAPGTVENGLIKNGELLKNALERLRNEAFPAPIKSPYVIVNLAEEHSFSRIIQLPPLAKNEFDEAIKWEVESNIPLPVEKVYISWQLLPKKDTAEKKESVFLAATPKNIIDNLLEILRSAKLIPVAIESESTALIRSLAQTQSFPPPEIPLMVVNLKEYCSHIIVFSSRVVILSTTSENSSQKFDAAIENAFRIKQEDAEKFRQRIGWNMNEELGRKLIEATEIPFSALQKDIAGSISFFSSNSGKEIKEILLTGEKYHKWKDFDKYLEKEMGLPVKWHGGWNPNIWPLNCPYVTEEKEEYNIAIGLALRKLEEDF